MVLDLFNYIYLNSKVRKVIIKERFYCLVELFYVFIKFVFIVVFVFNCMIKFLDYDSWIVDE